MQLHKALYSGHNDHNYFEIAHTVKRQMDMGLGRGVRLYSFVDNHDVERIHTKLQNKAHFLPVHVLLYTLPGIPSIYYGSEFGIEGRKERGSDASLRPCLDLEAFAPKRAEGKRPEEMSVEELQAEILARLKANGPVTDRMLRDVRENVYRDSLLNWLRSR